jgi:conjugative transfer signal peptidase TraF
MNKVFVWAVTGLIVGVTGAGAAGIRVNTTASMPRGLYRLGAPSKVHGGQMVAACPSMSPSLQQGITRGFIGQGLWACPAGMVPLLKVVVAVGGDRVDVAENGSLTVNGAPIPNSEAKAVDGRGRALLRMIPPGHYEVPPGAAWLVNSHNPWSFDSRYFGPIKASEIIGTAEPVLTE